MVPAGVKRGGRGEECWRRTREEVATFIKISRLFLHVFWELTWPKSSGTTRKLLSHFKARLEEHMDEYGWTECR